MADKKMNPSEKGKEEEIAKEIEELEKEDTSSEVFKTAFKIALGIIFVLVGAVLWFIWSKDFFVVVRGCIGPFLIFAGIVAVAIAKE